MVKARKQYTPFGTFLPEIIMDNSNRNHHAVRTSSSKSNCRTTSEYSFRRELTPDPRKVSILASNKISKEILYRCRYFLLTSPLRRSPAGAAGREEQQRRSATNRRTGPNLQARRRIEREQPPAAKQVEAPNDIRNIGTGI
jgi:hypothetical protein